MYYYAQHSTNGIECFKVEDEKRTIQNYLKDLDNTPFPPFEYLTEMEVKGILAKEPDGKDEFQKARYNELKAYSEGDYSYPCCLVSYPFNAPERTYGTLTPEEDNNVDYWEELLNAWADWSNEFDELPQFFTADEAAEKVEEALDDYNEDKAEEIIRAVFDVGKEYQTKAIVACLKLRDELENFSPGDEIPEEVFDGDIGTLCEFAGTDCPSIEAGDLYTEEDWGRKGFEYIDNPEEYFKEFLAENENLKLPIVNGEVDWDNLDAETEQWGAGAWRDYVDSKNADFCSDCLKAIQDAFEALNWTFGTTF